MAIVDVYAILIKRGLRTLDSVPENIKVEVEEKLSEQIKMDTLIFYEYKRILKLQRELVII